jgi:hypothetical protein
LLGEIALATEPLNVNGVEANFSRALELASTLGMRPLAAHCYEGMSRLHTKRDQPLQAEEALTQARSIWSSLGS